MPIEVKIYSLAISNITHQQPTITYIIDHLNNKNIYIRKITKELIKEYPLYAEVIKDIILHSINNCKIYNIVKNNGGFVISMDLVI